MRMILRIAALIVLLAMLGFWVARGHNLGWNKSFVRHYETDPVTGIEGSTEEKKFIPGVEFLAEGLFATGLLAGGSFLFRKPA